MRSPTLIQVGDALCWMLVLMAISFFGIPEGPALLATALRHFFP